MPKRLTTEQRAAMLDIISDINGERISGLADLPDDMPEWFLDWPICAKCCNDPTNPIHEDSPDDG